MTPPSIREIVETTMAIHPKDCVFAPDAIENICEFVSARNNYGEQHLIDLITEGFKRNEIYCPHEGIDRRHLYKGLSAEIMNLPALEKKK